MNRNPRTHQTRLNAIFHSKLYNLEAGKITCTNALCMVVIPGDHLNVKRRYQAHPKNHVKRVFFSHRALYMRNVNRVSNPCKIGLIGYDFLEILCI